MTNRKRSAIMTLDEQTKMSQVWRGHWQRSGSACRSGHKQGQGGSGPPERQEGRLAKGQTEEEIN